MEDRLSVSDVRDALLLFWLLLFERFVTASEFLLEFLDAAHGIYELLLTRVERMRCT